MNYWWVGQNQTYEHEVHGGYLWSPKTNSNGAFNRFYHSMTEVQPGDVIFSFADTYIKAVGVATGVHQSASKPTEFGTSGANWTNEGWRVPVTFTELANPIRPADHMGRLRSVLPDKYSPLQASGRGNQVYLAPVPLPLANELVGLLGGQVEGILAGTSPNSDAAEGEAIASILDNSEIPATQRAQLIQARIGQGLFRSRVSEIEPCCRVTGISDVRFLIASHIKPWSKSDNVEKLAGANGLLLAPHVDRLFDKGYITFEDDGSLRISVELPESVKMAWGISAPIAPTALSEAQRHYMAYHRAEVFLDHVQSHA